MYSIIQNNIQKFRLRQKRELRAVSLNKFLIIVKIEKQWMSTDDFVQIHIFWGDLEAQFYCDGCIVGQGECFLHAVVIFDWYMTQMLLIIYNNSVILGSGWKQEVTLFEFFQNEV
eukprot:TRINITY_DN7962_c0_g2_i3.p3 TRINITY_DN7962_c0_g2~~TRINITY_DN7962_c0_g2_i3.p3  ORF type:complete len:115 (-),score=4.70 TRINITY_DN7962_c0_g2_i3:54-398(-)